MCDLLLIILRVARARRLVNQAPNLRLAGAPGRAVPAGRQEEVGAPFGPIDWERRGERALLFANAPPWRLLRHCRSRRRRRPIRNLVLAGSRKRSSKKSCRGAGVLMKSLGALPPAKRLAELVKQSKVCRNIQPNFLATSRRRVRVSCESPLARAGQLQWQKPRRLGAAARGPCVCSGRRNIDRWAALKNTMRRLQANRAGGGPAERRSRVLLRAHVSMAHRSRAPLETPRKPINQIKRLLIAQPRASTST